MTHSTTIAAMTEDEYIAHFAESIQSYAKEKVASGQWSAEEASARAQAETDALLTDGFATPGHWFYTLRDGDGAKVGSIWVSQRVQGGRKIAWLTDIVIATAFRRRGHARRALVLVQQDIQTHGLPGVGLHVFGHNTAAQALYASLGYAVTNVNMYLALE